MPTVTLAPTSTVSNVDWSNVGGAGSLHAALADVSDTTYMSRVGGATVTAEAVFGFGAASLPDGSAIQSIAATVRAAKSGGGGSPLYLQTTVSALKADTTVAVSGSSSMNTADLAWVDYPLGTAGAYNSQTVGDLPRDVADRIRLQVKKLTDGAGGSSEIRVSKASIVVTYVRAPTATTGTVSGQSTTTKPTLGWTQTALDGVTQTEHQSVVWLVSDQANFPGGQAAMEATPDLLYGVIPSTGIPSGVAAMGADALGPYFTIGATTYRAKAWSKDSSTGLPGWRTSTGATYQVEQDLPLTGAHKGYTRAAGTYQSQRLYVRGSAGVASIAFTMAITPPVAPTSITPVWEYPGATVPNNLSTYRMKLTVALPSDTVVRKVKVERQVSGTGKWALLPSGAILSSVSTGAQSLTFYDAAASPNKAMQYRVSTGSTTVEVWGTPVVSGTSPTAVVDQFLLRDPTTTASPVILRIQGDLEASSREILRFDRGLGASLPLATSDAISGDSWPLEILVPNETDYLALLALRARRATLFFQGDMAGWYRWVRIGESWSEVLLRQTLRTNETFRARRVKLELIETWPIFGQPLRAGWGA